MNLLINKLLINCKLFVYLLKKVFVSVKINVQYQAIREKVYSAFYVLTDHEKQMRSYIFDVVRASLTQMTLDQSFESKEEISMSLKTHLQEVMTNYGYTILQALVTDVAPEAKVRDAMNEINASKRLKEAAYERAEGEKILKVKRAEGESESMYLSGVGIARERKAIMEGLKDSVLLFSHDVAGVNPKDIMDLLILNQYFDTIQVNIFYKLLSLYFVSISFFKLQYSSGGG
jgi:regulator of protease activity HflC (stomatin/prohibitin superfamily)